VPRTAIENAISANCLIVSREQWTSDRELFLVDEDGAATAKIDEIVRIVSEFGADLIILETQSRIAAIDENDNAAGARLVGVLEEIRDRTGATVLCVAHAGKMARQARTDTHGQNGLRGASALLDNARWGLWFRAVPKGDSGHDRIEIVNAKTFRCKRADSFKVDGVYPRLIPVDGVSPDAFDQVVEYIKANPGSTVRKVRAAVPGRGTTIGQAIRDAIDEGLVETREKRLHHVA
jgi:hypothetical protein